MQTPTGEDFWLARWQALRHKLLPIHWIWLELEWLSPINTPATSMFMKLSLSPKSQIIDFQPSFRQVSATCIR